MGSTPRLRVTRRVMKSLSSGRVAWEAFPGAFCFILFFFLFEAHVVLTVDPLRLTAKRVTKQV